MGFLLSVPRKAADCALFALKTSPGGGWPSAPAAGFQRAQQRGGAGQIGPHIPRSAGPEKQKQHHKGGRAAEGD